MRRGSHKVLRRRAGKNNLLRIPEVRLDTVIGRQEAIYGKTYPPMGTRKTTREWIDSPSSQGGIPIRLGETFKAV
jgi:hypothetical protein